LIFGLIGGKALKYLVYFPGKQKNQLSTNCL